MRRIFSLILALMAVQMMWAAPYTVTNTSDDVEKEGSLRWACNQASSNKSVEITFDIEGNGNKVIKLTSQIQIQGNVTIDASSSKDSIIIDANDMEYSDYCFYLNNDKTTKLSLKGLVFKNKKTSAIYSYTYNDSENTLDVLIDSCFFYSGITAYGGKFLIKNSSVFSNVIAAFSTSTSLEIADCKSVDNQQSYCCLLTGDLTKFVCSRTTFSRKNIDGSNPIHYSSSSIYSAPVIDTAYVKNGMLFVKGHVASEEIVDIELFSACGSYDPKSPHNRYDCTKYIGATKTNSKGIFSCELTLPEKGVKTKQHFVLSATATYSKAHTSSFAFYDVIQPYWVVTNTEAGSVIYASPVGSMGWACYFAGTNDTIAFDFPGKGTKEIEGNDVFSTNAFVDGSTYADTIILHGLECRNVNKIVSQNSTKINGFYVSEKITNCIARGNSNGITFSSPDCYIENCIAENNTDAGISTSVGGKARVIKNSVVRNNKVGIGCGVRLIENCEITNNSGKGIAAASNTYDIDTIRGCLISGNDIGIEGDIIFIENNIIGLTKDQKQAMPNRIGINSGKYKSCGKILNNVIAGNTDAGVFCSAGHDFSTFKNNYVGTNRYLDMNPSFGNGGDGLHIEATISKDQEFSNNYIMNNGGTGLYASVIKGTIENCIFSNNKKEGVRVTGSSSGVFKKCEFEGNEKEGLYSDASGSTYVVDSCDFSRNGTYGLYMSQCNFDLTNSTFDSNKGTAFVYDITKYDATTSLLSDNKFLHTNKPYPAFSTTNAYPVPEFTSCKMTEKTIVIEGKIDTAAKIELFYTSQGEQTAEMFVDSFDINTKTDGVFSISLDKSKFAGKSIIGFTATATYGGKFTSPLSDVVYPEMGKVDLTSTEFYVKVDGYGDGSSWEKAMSPQTFAYYLPQAKDGSTFHVAEGTYYPMYDGNKTAYLIKSDVTIKGGYPAKATTGAISNPKEYKTIFSGDFEKDDEVSFVKEIDGKYSLTHKNYEDNAGDLFDVYFEDKTKFVLDGVVLSHSYCGIYTSKKSTSASLNLLIENVAFEDISMYAVNSGYPQVSIQINHSSFSHNYSCLHLVSADVNIQNSKFEENGPEELLLNTSAPENSVIIDNVSFVRNSGMIYTDSEFSIKNSIFDSNVYSGNSNIYLVLGIGNTSMSILNTQFIQNETNGGLVSLAGLTIIDNCLFDGNKTISYTIGGETKEMFISNSTFENCVVSNGALIDIAHSKSLRSINSTYVNNTSGTAIFYNVYGKCELYNNTILSNKVTDNHSIYLVGDNDLKLVGNVIDGIYLPSSSEPIVSRNNIFLCDLSERGSESVWANEENAISLNASDCSDLFDGKYDSKNDKFEASLKDNGGFTPTVALKSDKLSDGKSIRFPRLDDVLTDQRGVSRLPETCMGAYELGCGSDTTFTTDTINVGDKILGQTFTKVGVHDSIFETLQTAMGCDSVVMHKVVVKPDPTKLNYYVKTKKAGKGDGSNWENAMDGDDFETYLPLAPDGATFYVAAGTYKPSSGTYNTSASDISIIGGFPADINIGADSKPDKYKTIFSADLKGNDKVSIIRTTDGIDSVTFANREDNASVILSMGNAKNTLSKSRLSGLVFEGATGIAVSLSGDYTVDHCEFKYNKDGLYLQTPLNIDLSKSYFHDNKIAYRKSRNEKTVTNETVDGCTFENNYCSILQSGIERLEVTNSTFYNNGFFEFYEGQNLLLKNNTIVGPYLFNATYTHTSPKTWNLLGNVTKVENYVRDNLFVCREEHPEIGDGSSTNPYKITSASELLWFSKLVSKGTDCQEANPSACAYLSTDIDLSTVCGKNIGNWTPITNFSGTFDGTGHTVSGLYYVSAEEGYVGLFGIIKEGAVVKNVTVSGYLRNGGTIGGVVGAASASTIENCKNLAFVQSTEKFAGGIAGYSNSSTIDRCCNFGTVIDTAGGYAKVGGICAGTSMATTITNCLNAGEITSIARGGGIIGSVDAENTKLSNSFNYGLVVSLGNTRNTDPICGYITQGSACSISNTYSLTQSKNVNVDVLTKEEFADGTLLANLSKNNAGVWTSGSEFPVLVTPMYSKYEGGSRVPEPEPISLLENNLWKYSISSKYNLFNLPSLGENWKYDETDLVYTTEDWSSFMEGSIDSKKFIPKLSYNGGFTPTVALKEDNLPNDTSIRFPLSETTVTEDQRGVSRLPETCMGAYELSKIDTVIVRDTIVLGKTYVFNDKEITPSKIGIYHDTMVVKKDNKEVTQVLKLYVKPYALFNCYVKKVAEGTGDGSSWENAMSGEDFAFVLPFAAVGADFYVAEGTYKPLYDASGNETDDPTSLCYRIKNNVSIYGGYPVNAKTGATPDPENHPTIFTGDIKGDDKVVKGKDEDGRLELTYVNHDENATQLFLCDGKMTMVSLHDVIVDGASYGIIFTKKDPHLDTDNTTFRNCYRAVYCPEGGAVVFTEDTKFENNSDYCLYTPNGWNTNISNTSFIGNTGYLVYTNSNMMSMDSVSVRGNNAQIYSTDISEFKISNSEFVDNESTGNLFYMNNIDNTAMFSNVEFVNNKIVQDVIGNYGSNGSRVMTVDNSIFKSNETGSYLINSTDGLIVRHSFVSDNQIASDMFFTYKLTLLSDTFELNKSKYIANPCLSGASIDSCLIKNNDSYLFHSAKSSTDNWRFDLINSDIVDNYKTNSEKNDYVIFMVSDMDSVNIARTKFIGNKYEEIPFIRNTHSYFDFEECIVDSNYVYNFIHSAQGQINVSNSSFVGNMSRILILCPNSGDAYSFGTGVTLKNNTFVNNIIKESLFDGYYSKSTIVNNTIVGNSSEMYLFGRLLSKNASVIGNILFGNINGRQQAYSGDLNKIAIDIFENNIMALDTSIIDGTVLSETNIISDFSFDEKVKKYTKQDFSKFKNHIDDVVSLFEGTYDATTGLFTPELKNNGGFTPTVALKSDKLSDGTSIRFPRLENVLTDQRGVERFDSTCMGAYEMRCNAVETVLKDTVMVGDSYTFIDKNLDDVCQKVGSYHFTETLKSAEGCDSIVKLSLAVRPQKNENGYYVKVNGTGDGSDWNNAMSPKDFAEYLPLVYDGETFHIAAGTYKSTYVDPELGRMYNINSSVTLIGGYPDTVTTVGVPPMPENFTTTLSANERGHINFYKERTGDFSVSGFGSNDSILIRVNGTSSVSLYGITLSGVKSSDNYGAVTMGQGGTLNLDRCTIENNNTSAVVASGAKINVTSSLAYHNVSKDGAVFRLSQSDLNVENSSFHENVSSDESSASRGAVANLTASQANFKNNTIANNWADKGAVFALSNSQVTLYNNTLVGNQPISKESNGSFVSASDSKSKATLFGNMIVGNGAKPVDGTSIESEGYNIFSTDFQGLGVETDMFMGSNDYVSVMDGAPMLENADVFIPNVGDNGGLTPTIAVIESMFDGGAVISIPSDQRKVNEDQREMVRKDTSCVGAFEFPTYVNYFVKQLPVGDGTGRDWDNAMGDTTFSRYFSIVPTGVTFHVAAGTYRPLEDRRYRTNSYKNRLYYSSRPLNVFGGYHPQAKIGAVADPSKYVTLLSSDFNGDDEFAESSENYTVMSYSNHNDNSSYVMTINSKVAGDVQLKGLTFSGNFTQFRGSSAALTVSAVAPEIPIALTIDSCSFEKTYVGIYSYADSLIVRNCRFDTIEYLGVSHYPRESVPSMLVVENSSFTNMSSAISTLASKGRVVLQNSTFNNAMSLVNVNTNSYNNVVDLNLEMYHNTFGFSSKSYQGISIPQYIKTIAKGNIFNTNFLLTSDYSGTNAMTPIVSDYNLFVEEPDTTFGAWTLGENDMLVAPSDLTGVMPGTMGEKRFLAVSSMEKSENFTKVVALESDVLNEKYIRMPMEEAKVKADQIATERLDLTCMGAYEFFKGRDTVYITSVDTVCYGLNYQRRGWNLHSDTLSEGEYVYGRFLRGKIATDTIDTLTLHVNPFSKIMLDQLAVAPTLCHGDGYGEVMFTPYSVVPGSANVYVKDETGDTLSSDVQIYNSVYNNKELPLGKFDINIISQTQCVKDTSIHIEVVDRDSLQPLNKIDNILTDCANEPTSVLSISMKGFHPTMKFYHNDVEVTEETKDDELVYEDDAAVTSLANLNLSGIPVGKHIITAVDACDNTYVLSEFDVSVSPSQLVEMQLVDYTKDSLACGLDNGFAKFNIISGATSVFTLTSDEGYDYTLRLQGKDTVLVLNDLVRGNYKALLKKVDEKCSDSSEAEFSIFSPEPLSLSLASNGAACAEGAVSAVAQGGRGSYTFHWTDPSGKSFDTTTPVLSEASAGTYKCVVEDATHCLSHTESLSILPNVEELSELRVDSVVTKDITCISGNNGTIEVRFSTDNKQQSVACAVTNDATGEVTSVAGTYKNLNGLLAIRTLAVGSYSYEVYYGSETCRLDTNSFKGTFTVSAKAVPFKMSPLAVASPQTCFNPANGTISNTVTGWENDYKAYMVSKTGGKYMMSPVEENGDTKLKVDTLSAGSFYYVVEDACGSKINTDTVALPKYEPLSLEIISFTDSVTCARATDAEIMFAVNGGIGLNHLAFVDEKSYTDKDTIVSSDNGKGYHYVAYKSVVEGCKDSVGERIRIAGPDTLAIKFTLNGNCPGSALIPEVTGESAPYTYWWSDGENDIEGTAEFPFEMEEGRTYSLTVSDDHKCDEYTKSFTIPSAAELPSISHVVSPSSEKCYKGNNGNIKVKASISKPLDFAISATIKCEKVDDPKTSFVYQCVLDPDGTYNTPETLSPGYYRVTTRLGSFDCDMGVDPADTVVHVDTLSPLNIQSDFKLTPHTCEQANGTAKFNVEGWANTHTAILYTLDENRTAEIKPAFVTNYVADFRLKLRHGKYKVVVIDKCGQSDTSDVFEILHKPTFVDKVTSKPATCINEPNGVLDFDVQGWTSNHTCELINKDNAEFGYFGNVKPVEVVDSTKFAHFHIDVVPAGEWRIRVTNECGDNCQFENLVKVDGIDPYKVELIANESKLELTCPYDTNGVISLNVTGGCKDALLSGNTTRKVTYWGPTGIFVDSFVWEEKEIYTIVPIFDTLNPIIENDTTFNIASMDTVPDHNGKDSIVINYDTIVTQRTTYPQLVDKEGNLVNDTIVTIDSIQVSIPVEKYGWLDSLATSPIEYDAFIADPEGFKSGKYKFVNLRAATYRFTYKTALNGCTDKYDFDTKVTKPDDVHLNYAVMSITCSTKSDGEISLAPRRGSKSYSSYFVGHDTTDVYEKNRLYKHDLIDGKDSIVEYKLNDETQSYQINQLYDQTDLTSVSWSFSQTKDGKFVQMSDIIFPDSTDFYEEIYYKNGNPTTSPVYSNSHLEKFWKDRMGEYFEANVVSIANLRHGFYEALVVDNKACKYRDTIEVKYPAKPLKIDNVVFDEALAECNPTARQIMTYVSGGWGDYGYSFSEEETTSDSPGEKSDGYRGGEASYSDNDKLEGWGVSSFLDPGTYKVAVFDKNGCIVESPNKYTVKTTFSLSIDTVETVCAEDDSAAVAIKFIESPVSGMTYDVVEYESPCRTDAMDECREFTLNTKKQNVTPDGNAIVLNLSTEKRRIKTHGLFVYKNDDNHCGTYVEGTVVDTIPIFKASRKSIKDVTCNGLADGMIELFVNGGKAPYKVQRNSSWNSGDELALYAGLNDAGLNTLVHKDTLKIIDLNDTTKNRDTVIVTNYVQITDLPADSFYFTVVDAKGCRSVMGNPANYDEKIFVKEPEALHVDFAASIVCKDPSVTTGGNVFFQNLTGGVAPYTLSCSYEDNGTINLNDCEYVTQIPVAKEGFNVAMKVTDANHCSFDSVVTFRPGELNIDQYNFWATTWYEFGDVVALIDVCGPDDILDSVAYVFKDETGTVDSRIKILDERMYIYDLESNRAAQNTLLHYADRTKEVVPDLFFKKNFRLRDGLTEDQAKHLHFFKFEDSSVSVTKTEDLQDVLAKHSVLMKAYFNGCEYQVDRNGADVIGVMKPGKNDKLDKIGQRYQIISLTGSPNPFGKDETITIRATFSEKVDAKLYFYFIDGKESKHFDISSAEIKEEKGELVYSREFVASSLFQSEIPDYVIVFLTTGRDQKSTTLLHSGVVDFSK